MRSLVERVITERTTMFALFSLCSYLPCRLHIKGQIQAQPVGMCWPDKGGGELLTNGAAR